MRGIVWVVLLFTVAVVAATLLGSNDGLVSVYWSGWRTDISLNLALIVLVVFCAVVTLAWQAVYSLTTLPRRAGDWRALRKERVAQAALREALAEYFGGRWGRSHKAANKALVVQQDTPQLAGDREFETLARLLAAASLHRLQDRAGRDAALAQVLARGPRAASRVDDGARLLAAEWAVEDRDVTRAQRLLDELPPGLARRTQALRLRLQTSRAARQPLQALHTAHLLANHGAFSEAVASGLLRALAFEAIDGTHDVAQLRKVWDQIDTADRRDPFVLARVASRAAQLGAPELGRDWLREAWDRLGEFDREGREQLALALVSVAEGIGPDWLPRLEAAQANHGHEPAVVAAVGTAFAERQLWGKAGRLLEQAAAASSLPAALRRRAWRRLAQLAQAQGDDAQARQCERAAAAID